MTILPILTDRRDVGEAVRSVTIMTISRLYQLLRSLVAAAGRYNRNNMNYRFIHFIPQFDLTIALRRVGLNSGTNPAR